MVLSGVPAALAADGETKTSFEITPFIGYRFGGDFEYGPNGETLEMDESQSFGVVLDYNIEPDKQVEFCFSRQDTSFTAESLLADKTEVDVMVDYYHIGGVYLISGEKLRPFVSGGIGVTHMSPEASGLSSETKASLAIGTGVKWYVLKNLGLRLEAKGIYTFVQSDTALFSKNGNLSVYVKSNGIIQGEGFAGLMLMF
jgi:opacity protein-like surface antigen